jgi:hypothetical protein
VRQTPQTPSKSAPLTLGEREGKGRGKEGKGGTRRDEERKFFD